MSSSGRLKSPPRELSEEAVGTNDYIASLTRRLENLERKVLGKRVPKDQPPLFHMVDSIQKKLDDCVIGTNESSTRLLWNKVEKLEQILKPNFLEETRSSQRAEENLLICYADQLGSVAPSPQVEELQQLKDYVNSTEFQGLENHEKKLNKVTGRQGEQERELEKLTEEVQDLMKNNYQIMLQLSAQCVIWQEELSDK